MKNIMRYKLTVEQWGTLIPLYIGIVGAGIATGVIGQIADHTDPLIGGLLGIIIWVLGLICAWGILKGLWFVSCAFSICLFYFIKNIYDSFVIYNVKLTYNTNKKLNDEEVR